MKILGIDPGTKGALSLIDTKKGTVEIEDMPVYKEGKRTHVDGKMLGDFIEKWRPDFAALERVSTRSKDGVVGAFTFGANYGAVLAVVQCMLVKYKLPTPAQWKRMQKLIGKPKEASHAAACRLYPHASKLLTGPRGGLKIDRAEALLIADWGRANLSLT